MKNTKDKLKQGISKTFRTESELSPEDFRDFKLFLNKIKFNFNDFSLVGGAFRAESNDRTCIVETGFGYFSNMTFNISEFKKFLKLFSKLDKKNNITVTLDSASIILKDSLGPIPVPNSNSESINNKFITYKEMNEKVISNVDPNKLIVSEGISKMIVRRMNTASRKLYSNCISIRQDKKDFTKGFLSISGRADDSIVFQAKLKKPLIIPLKKNHYFNLPVLPTLFNKDDMYLKSYFTKDQNIFSVFSTKVNDLFVNVYSRSKLFEES
jgi:hypothetical protein